MSPSERARFGRRGRGYQRADRVQEQLREVIAAELERRGDDVLETVTVTGVDCSPDLRNATIYYTVYGDEDAAKRAASRLADLTAPIRKHVADTVRLRYTPALRFAFDETIEQGMRIERLLSKLHEHDEEQP